jgi:hypothetical protein
MEQKHERRLAEYRAMCTRRSHLNATVVSYCTLFSLKIFISIQIIEVDCLNLLQKHDHA